MWAFRPPSLPEADTSIYKIYARSLFDLIQLLASSFFAQASPPSDNVFLQYGAMGVLAGLAILAVKVLFQKNSQAYDRERERADRLEAELQRLNNLIQDKYLTTLAEATRAISDAMAYVRDRRSP